jgi:hypothetical protein
MFSTGFEAAVTILRSTILELLSYISILKTTNSKKFYKCLSNATRNPGGLNGNACST